TRDDFGMAQCARERIVRHRFLWNAAIIEHGIEIKRAAAMHDGWLESLVYHMHVAHRMRVERAIRKGPVSVPCPLRRVSQKIAVERNVLSRKRAFFDAFGPVQKSMDEIGLTLFLRVRYLLLSEPVHFQRFVHDVRAVPYVTFFVKTIGRVRKVE